MKKNFIIRLVVLALAAVMILGIVFQGAQSAFGVETDENTVVVNSFSTGTLRKAIDDAKGDIDQNDIKSITIKNGEMSKDDFFSLQNLSQIEAIDLSETTIENGEIPAYIFSGKGSLISIKLPKNTTKINDGSFSGCNSLKQVLFQSKITEIGTYAFQNCENLKKFDLSNTVKLSAGSFSGCKALNEINLSNKLTDIPSQCFSDCNSLKSVTIPNNVEIIDSWAFQNCNNLKIVRFASITAPEINMDVFPNGVTIYCSENSTGYDTEQWQKYNIDNGNPPVDENSSDDISSDISSGEENSDNSEVIQASAKADDTDDKSIGGKLIAIVIVCSIAIAILLSNVIIKSMNKMDYKEINKNKK